jgi:uncharacterized protein YegP (UPF0339 family)
MTFKYFQDIVGKWHWRLYDANAEEIAKSTVDYDKKELLEIAGTFIEELREKK